MTVVLEELELGGTAEPWTRLGFATQEDGSVRVGSVSLRFAGGGAQGIASWTLRGAPEGDLDGLPTLSAAGRPAEPQPAEHPNGALRLDHVVVFSPDLDRTLFALEAAGLDLRRIRDAGTVRQGFYRLGEVVLEVVGDVEPGGPARFWGLVAVVPDVDDLARSLGDLVGSPKDAVQADRRIVTVREVADLGLPLAFMTP